VKILVIEDDAEIVEFVSLAFEAGWPGCEVVPTHHGREAAELVEKEKPDVVLLDIGLPDISGFEVLKNIRLFSSVPVIIVTVNSRESDIVKGLGLGADEYVVKPFGQMEILARVGAVLRSHKPQEDATSVVLGPMQFNSLVRELSCGSTTIRLTPNESLILHRLMVKAGNVVTFGELADILWGESYPNSSDAIRVHVARLRGKIERIPRCRVSIVSKPGIGYIMEVQPLPASRQYPPRATSR
jgi:two-component system KDP operon response regulator KdpE